MAASVNMPRMGESVNEGTVERWLIADGDWVDVDQVLCEITTDKVDAEVTAMHAGAVEIVAPQGATVKVGQELARIDTAAAKPAAGAAKARNGEREPPAAKQADPALARAQSAAPSTPAEADARVTPLARRIAADRGVALHEVPGTGPGGRVTKQDVLARAEPSAATQPAAADSAAPAAREARPPEPGTLGEYLASLRIPTVPVREGDRVVPFTSIRRRIAEHMVVSKIVSPHVGTVAEVDLHKLVALRDKHKKAFAAEHGFNLTFLPLVVAATVRGLKRFPRLNATVGDQAIIERAGVHIGVAVETDRGLVVPVIRHADRLSVIGLVQAIEDLATRARDRQVTADELAGGTFTVSNPGRQGNLYGFAVINQPQVGILRMGEVRKRPVVIERDGEDTIAIRPMMYLALSYDHRIIDGVTGNGFLYTVAKELEAAELEI
jgi:2-oxoglutarate dehydrogenase E2 component (dihydrolipoamide succinyltransferase)